MEWPLRHRQSSCILLSVRWWHCLLSRKATTPIGLALLHCAVLALICKLNWRLLQAMPLFGCYCSSLVAILQMRCHIAVPIWPSASLKYSVIFSQHGPRATKNKCQWPLEGTVSVGVACREHCQPVSYQLRRSLIAIGCGPFASLIVIDAQYSIIPLCAHCVHSDQLSPH